MKSTKPFNQRYFKKLSGRVLLLILLFIGALFLFGVIIHEVLWEKEEAVDHMIFDMMATNVMSPQLTPFMKSVTYCASATFLQIAYSILALLYLVQKDWKRAGEIAVVGVGGFVINYYMKLTFQRPRPSDPVIDALHNFSFPSGHATSAFIFYGLLTYLIWKTSIPRSYKFIIGSLLILFSLLIGFSRVYLRMHYPSDVLAGFCIGFAWLAICIGLMERLKKKSEAELKTTDQYNQ